MLQRQIMFKQLQELQRRQQLQELGNTRHQNYVNQMSSLKQASGGQFSLKDNGIPAQFGNMQMMQHGGPSGLVLSQTHNDAGPVGLSQPQFDVSLYGTHASNSDKHLSQYPQLQGPSNLSVNPSIKNSNSPRGMTSVQVQPSGFGSSFINQQCNFSSDQISIPDESFLSNPEKNLFGQAPVDGYNGGVLSGNYYQQGTTTQRTLLESEGRHDDAGWLLGKTSKVGLSQSVASLDPLEQKILFNTDDNSWESSFGRSSKMFESTVEHTSEAAAMPSIQSGTWSALMQSAVAETSSNDPGIQEEWSGLSYQNPEPLNDNQPPNFMDSEKLQNNWVDRNLQNASSPSSRSEHLFQNFNTNCSFTNFQQLGHQYPKKEEYHSDSSHATAQYSPRKASHQLADYISQQKHPTGGSQLIQTSLPSTNIWSSQNKEHLNNDAHQASILSCNNDNQSRNNFSGHEFRGTSWLQGSGSNQKSYDQVNHLNVPEYAVESDNMAPGENVEAVSTLLGVSLQHHGESVTAPSESMLELLNKDDLSNDPTPAMQLNSKVSIPRELPSSETSVASFAKPCNSSLSPDFGFRLGPADPQIPQSYSFFPSLSMGTSSTASISSHSSSDFIKNQGPSPPVPSGVAAEFPAYTAAASQNNSKLKINHSSGPQFENVSVTQPSLISDMRQHVGFMTSLPTPWPEMANQQDASQLKPDKFSNLFRSPDSASSSHETSSAGQYEQNNESSLQHEDNVQEMSNERRIEKGSSLQEGLTDINNMTPPSRSNLKQEFLRKHHLEADDVGSGSLMANTHQLPSNQAEGREKDGPFPPRDDGVIHHSLSQNYSLLHQIQSARTTESEGNKSDPPKYDSVDYQQSIANARELFVSGQKSGVKEGAKSDPYVVSQLGAFWSGDNKGWNFSQDAQGDQSGKDLSSSHHQNLQQMNMFSQNDTQNRFIGGSEASNLTYQSQVSLQMAPSWFKQYGTLINGQRLPVYDPRAAMNVSHPLSEMTLGKSQENSLAAMQVRFAKASQGSGLYPSTIATSIVCKQLNPTSAFPSAVTCQHLSVSIPKKRKLVELDMVPWHKEVNHKQSRLLDISTAELVWADALNRRQEEVKSEAESVEELPPVIRAKRRLIYNTQLMQQVFQPAPAVILWSDTSSNCGYVAYSAARLTLGDACSLNCGLPYGTTDESFDKLKTSKRANTFEFSKVVEGYINRVKKLDGDLSRLEKSLTIVDIKLEAQELEKFSIINRFAKFHIKAHPSTVDPASSSGTPAFRNNLQRYVAAVPMPRVVPEGSDCLSL